MSEPVETAYQRTYDRFSGDVFRFALAWTNDWASAEDLTQEAYLRLWRHRASIDWERPMLGWLLVTTAAWRTTGSGPFAAAWHRLIRTPHRTRRFAPAGSTSGRGSGL